MAAGRTFTRWHEILIRRLEWAGHLGESPALSIGDIADRLQASSPQSFSRTVRSVLALTPGQLRRGYDGRAMLERFSHLLMTNPRAAQSRRLLVVKLL